MPELLNDEFSVLTRSAAERVNAQLVELLPDTPESLYDPLRYLHKSGGKRLRAILTYLASRSNPDANWIPAACAIECLHTFTLIHDDIMDNAPTRRGQKTLHKKYDINTAILAGDVLIAIANESLARVNYDSIRAMLAEFAHAFRLVCEGQALDKEFENAEAVTIDAYFQMIDLKSAKMIEAAAVLGAYTAGGKYIEELRTFAHHIGLAFQVRDDLLDLTADEHAFGKTKGGDILEGKRSYLVVKAMDMFTDLSDAEQILVRKVQGGAARLGDVAKVEKMLRERGILANAEADILRLTAEGKNALASLPDGEFKNGLMLFSDHLLGREI